MVLCPPCPPWSTSKSHGSISSVKWTWCAHQRKEKNRMRRGMAFEGGGISQGAISQNITFSCTDLRSPQLRYLDPDPLLLISTETTRGSKSNPRFHALNQAIAQLVSIASVLSCSLLRFLISPRLMNTHSCRSCPST